jgi:hypothetical protein
MIAEEKAVTEQKVLDIAHISFLGLIKSCVTQTGSAPVKGVLMRNASAAGEKLESVNFESMDEFVASIDDLTNPIAKAEGRAVYFGHGLFGLPHCPFGPSITSYKTVYGDLPLEFAEVTSEFNKTGPQTDKLKVGNGAGVSPFCAVHQPLRSVLGGKITIGEKPVAVYQLGCKSGSGIKGLANKWIDEAGYTAEEVMKVLDEHMCCYAVKIVE